MKSRGILKEGEEAPAGLDLAQLIMKNYIVYPTENNDAVIPINYCMLPKVAPGFLKAPLKYLTSLIC